MYILATGGMEVVTAREQRKPAISVLSTTLNQLWGADRVLRTVQYLSRIIANSPEVRELRRALRLVSEARFHEDAIAGRAPL